MIRRLVSVLEVDINYLEVVVVVVVVGDLVDVDRKYNVQYYHNNNNNINMYIISLIILAT